MITLAEINQIAKDNHIVNDGIGKTDIEVSLLDSSFNENNINRVSSFIKHSLKNKKKTINKLHDSTQLKRIFEKYMGRGSQISNGEFIIAMIYNGFSYKYSPESLKCYFNCVEKDIKTIEKYNLY